jgi:adenylate cyclase
VKTPGELLHELKRRKVVRVALVYAATAFVLLQAADIMLPRLGVPEAGMTLIVVLVVLGFPLALVLGWALEVTPEGVRTTAPVSSAETTGDPSGAGAPALLGWGTILVTGALVVLGLGIGLGWGSGRLLPPSPEDPPTGATPSDDPGAPAPADDRSIAVLAFANMSDDPAGEYFADGLSEEILNVLSQVPDLQVAGRTSSFAWKGRDEDLRVIGSTLGVAHVLEGSVRRQNNQVRVTAQLIRAADGFHLWSDTYDHTLDDVFAIQDDIAASVLTALRIVLDEDQRRRMEEAGVRNVDAFVAYQRGRELFGMAHSTHPLLPTLVRANEYFDEAIARVPDFGAAHFRKSDYYAHILSGASVPTEEREAALDSLQALLRTAAETSRSPLRRALIEVDRTLFSSDWRGLGERVERALELNGCPEPTWIEVGAVLGYADAVSPLFRRMTECDPLDESGWFFLASATLLAGDAEGALGHVATGRRDGGGENPFVANLARAANLSLGRFQEAMDEAERIPVDEGYWGPTRRVLPLAAMGRIDEAVDALARARETLGDDDDRSLLFAYAALGMRNEANAVASAVDRWPAGWMLLTVMIQQCYCGVPFDLEATPNLRSRIREAGVEWPPPTVVRYPAKDW